MTSGNAPWHDLCCNHLTLSDPSNSPSQRHTRIEDALALLTGVLLISIGIAFFRGAGLLTGGTAGLAFLMHYGTGVGFGAAFFLINVPFYWMAWRKIGGDFTAKTFCAVLLLALLTDLQPHFLSLDDIHPLYAAIAGGTVTGAGFLALFRHRASLGGLGILVVYLQDQFGWRAGKVQMVLDCCIVLLALAVVEPSRVGWSVVAAVAMNLVLAVNHKPGRYVGT